mmetsp:Transcript_79013/g.169306  ORF Transcript_79013/g.169306 Transcript_79013/m.169306 type:complete len:318 (+) Transcript_79013:537-1490(+)
MLLPLQNLSHIRKQLWQRDFHLRNEAYVNMSCSDGGRRRYPTAMASHQLHQTNAVRVCRRLAIGGVDRPHGFCTRSVEPEGAIHQSDVVVDGFGYANHSALVPDLCHRFEALHRTLVSSVTAENKILPDVVALQGLRYLRVGRIPAVAHEDAAALHMDVLHGVVRQFDPPVVLHATLIAPDNAINLLHTVGVQHLHDLADDTIQARAEAATSDNCRCGAWFLGVEMYHLGGSTAHHLQVGARGGVGSAMPFEDLRCPGAWLDEHALTARGQGVRHGILQRLRCELLAEVYAFQPCDRGARREHRVHLDWRRQVLVVH